jgi:hypothetical protein
MGECRVGERIAVCSMTFSRSRGRCKGFQVEARVTGGWLGLEDGYDEILSQTRRSAVGPGDTEKHRIVQCATHSLALTRHNPGSRLAVLLANTDAGTSRLFAFERAGDRGQQWARVDFHGGCSAQLEASCGGQTPRSGS